MASGRRPLLWGGLHPEVLGVRSCSERRRVRMKGNCSAGLACKVKGSEKVAASLSQGVATRHDKEHEHSKYVLNYYLVIYSSLWGGEEGEGWLGLAKLKLSYIHLCRIIQICHTRKYKAVQKPERLQNMHRKLFLGAGD